MQAPLPLGESPLDASKLFSKSRIVPVVVIEDAAVAVELAKTLRDAGATSIEVTLRTACALEAIELIAEQVPDLIVGAGSIRRPDQIGEIAARGAQFAVSPGATELLIDEAINKQMPLVPGAATASEMIRLSERGYQLQKFFPAELLGGVPMLKAVSGPLPEIKFFPTGGISAAIAKDYLNLACVSCIGGSWFVPAVMLREKDFAGIRKLVVEAMGIGAA